MFGRIKKLWQKKPFRSGDKIRCPCCGVILMMIKTDTQIYKGEIVYETKTNTT